MYDYVAKVNLLHSYIIKFESIFDSDQPLNCPQYVWKIDGVLPFFFFNEPMFRKQKGQEASGKAQCQPYESHTVLDYQPGLVQWLQAKIAILMKTKI